LTDFEECADKSHLGYREMRRHVTIIMLQQGLDLAETVTGLEVVEEIWSAATLDCRALTPTLLTAILSTGYKIRRRDTQTVKIPTKPRAKVEAAGSTFVAPRSPVARPISKRRH
jgi:hypothetical protein